MSTPTLPAGYTCRPATMADDQAVVDLINAAACQHLGYPTSTLPFLHQDWLTPGFNLETDSCLVFSPQGELVAYYMVWDPSEPHVKVSLYGRVHPAHTRRGIGTYLIHWAEARARESIRLAPEGARVILSAAVPVAFKGAPDLFAAIGLPPTRPNLRMVIDFQGPPPEPVWPEGIRLTAFRPEDKLPMILAIRAAFQDHWGYVERPLEHEVAEWDLFLKEENPNVDPSLYFLAWDGDEVVATSMCDAETFDSPGYGWIGTLGVVRRWRRRGLARAMLLHSFGALYQRGLKGAQLGVDAESLTGATRLYEQVGMHSDPAHTLMFYEKELRPGQDLVKQALE